MASGITINDLRSRCLQATTGLSAISHCLPARCRHCGGCAAHGRCPGGYCDPVGLWEISAGIPWRDRIRGYSHEDSVMELLREGAIDAEMARALLR